LLDTQGKEDKGAEHAPPAGDGANLGVRDVRGVRIGLGDRNFHDAIAALADFPVDVILELVSVEPALVEVDSGIVEKREPIGAKAVGEIGAGLAGIEAVKQAQQFNGEVTEGWQADAGTPGEKTAALNIVSLVLEKWREEKGNLFGVVFVVPGHNDHDVEAFATPVCDGGAEATADATGELVENGDAVSGEERCAVVAGGIVEAEKLVNEARAKAGGHESELWGFIEKRKDSKNAVSGIERGGCSRGRDGQERLRCVHKRRRSGCAKQGWIHKVASGSERLDVQGPAAKPRVKPVWSKPGKK
jgi:hypothetical protein